MVDLLTFVPACLALNLAFGPNNLLSITYGAQRGVGFAIVAGLGRLAVFVPMILASALGLGLLLATSMFAFNAIKIIGAFYLGYLGIRLLRKASKAGPPHRQNDAPTIGKALRNEGLVAAGNPKAILIFAAFFPQFIDADSYWLSYATLSPLFLLLEAFAILAYGTLGRFLSGFAETRRHWIERISATGMIVFAALLLLSRHPARPA